MAVRSCSFVEYNDQKIVYKRYASLYFCCATGEQENFNLTDLKVSIENKFQTESEI